MGPPKAGILYLKGFEHFLTGFSGAKGKGMGEFTAFQNALQDYLAGFCVVVAKEGAHFNIGLIHILIQYGMDVKVLYGNVSVRAKGNAPHKAHTLIFRSGAPVHPAKVEVPGLRPFKPHLKEIPLSHKAGYVKLPHGKDAEGGIL